jgi:hypothetical protein
VDCKLATTGSSPRPGPPALKVMSQRGAGFGHRIGHGTAGIKCSGHATFDSHNSHNKPNILYSSDRTVLFRSELCTCELEHLRTCKQPLVSDVRLTVMLPAVGGSQIVVPGKLAAAVRVGQDHP